MAGKKKFSLFKKIAVISITASFILYAPLNVSASGITETNIFNLTNSQRASNGMGGLGWNYKLASAARAKAQDMIDKDYFSHTSPDGRTPWSFITSAGYNYIYAGENLAMNFSTSEETVNAWMNSGGHRANILSGNFTELGVGVVSGEYQGYQTTVVVQMFGAQATQVYGKGKSSTGSRGSSSSSAPVAPAISEVSLTVPSSEIIKRRIEDFKKASNYLIEIVKDGQKKT